MSTVSIQLDQPLRIYTPGDTISGVVILAPHQTVHISRIRIYIRGHEAVTYGEAIEFQKCRERFLNDCSKVWKSNALTGHALSTGEHRFPFRICMPCAAGLRPLLSPMKDHRAEVAYTLKAEVERPMLRGNASPLLSQSVPLRFRPTPPVLPPVDVRTRLILPNHSAEHIGAPDTLSLRVSIPRGNVQAGAMLHGSLAVIDPPTDRHQQYLFNAGRITLSFIQHRRYTMSKDVQSQLKVITSKELSWPTENPLSFSLPLPVDLLPSTVGGQLVHILYQLKVQVMAGNGAELAMDIAVTECEHSQFEGSSAVHAIQSDGAPAALSYPSPPAYSVLDHRLYN